MPAILAPVLYNLAENHQDGGFRPKLFRARRLFFNYLEAKSKW